MTDTGDTVQTVETPAVDLKIEIDRSKITLGDMLFMTEMSSKSERGEDTGNGSVLRMLKMLERIIVGGIENIPYDALEDVMKAVGDSLANNPKIKN